MTNTSSGGGAGDRVTVLVVDDSAFMRKAIAQILSRHPGIEVVATARDGRDGLDKCLSLRPDVVTLDVEMPEMNGQEALKRIRAQCVPGPGVIMCSSLTSEGSHEALRALRAGADDAIGKPSGSISLDIEVIGEELVARVLAIGAARRARRAAVNRAAAAANSRANPGPQLAPAPVLQPTPHAGAHRVGSAVDLVVIGASTGGPPVLETIVSSLPAGFAVPVVIAQHMPVLFTKSLAERLGAEGKLPCSHGEDGMPVVPGRVYVAPGGQHTRVRRRAGGSLVLEIGPEPRSAVFRPSVDELFASAAAATGARTLAAICTGMGEDGAVGARALKAAGATVLAQDPASSVVYGMPRAVAVAGLADASLPPDGLAARIAAATPPGRVAA